MQSCCLLREVEKQLAQKLQRSCSLPSSPSVLDTRILACLNAFSLLPPQGGKKKQRPLILLGRQETEASNEAEAQRQGSAASETGGGWESCHRFFSSSAPVPCSKIPLDKWLKHCASMLGERLCLLGPCLLCLSSSLQRPRQGSSPSRDGF